MYFYLANIRLILLTRNGITAEKYRTLFDFAPVGLLTLNNEGVILEINLFCARMPGIDRPLLLNRNL
jgi:hypothetical protein